MLGSPHKTSYTTCMLGKSFHAPSVHKHWEAWIGSGEVPLAQEAITDLARTNPNVSCPVTKERLSSAYQVRNSLSPNSMSLFLLFRKSP